MEKDFKDMTNDLAELKANIRHIVNKYGITYLGVDITEDESTVNIEGKSIKNITLSIEI